MLAIPSRVAAWGIGPRLDNHDPPFPSVPFRAADGEAIRTLGEAHGTEPDVENVRISVHNRLLRSVGGT